MNFLQSGIYTFLFRYKLNYYVENLITIKKKSMKKGLMTTNIQIKGIESKFMVAWLNPSLLLKNLISKSTFYNSPKQGWVPLLVIFIHLDFCFSVYGWRLGTFLQKPL